MLVSGRQVSVRRSYGGGFGGLCLTSSYVGRPVNKQNISKYGRKEGRKYFI